MRTRITTITFFALFFVIAASLIVYLDKSAVYAELNTLNLIPQPERFTELYFEDASNLPRKTVAKQGISFSFGIHNVEYATTVYPYEVDFEYPDGSEVAIAQGTVTLASNASTTIPVTYVFQDSNVTGKVVVTLPSENNQSIDFLLPNTN
jgi:hypothetical protein